MITALAMIQSFALVFTGNQLLDQCRRETTVCNYYIAGAMDMLTQHHGPGTREPQVCVPIGGTAAQIRDIVVRYLEANPEQRHLMAAGFVEGALRQAYPCPRNSN